MAMIPAGTLLRNDTIVLCTLARMGGSNLTVQDVRADLREVRNIEIDTAPTHRAFDRLMLEGHLLCTGTTPIERNQTARVFSLTTRGKLEANLRLETLMAGLLGDAAR